EPAVTFWGAAHTVTGSMHLVAANGRRLLLDCGLFQGRRAEARERNARFPFDARAIDAVVLSHAHVDHCGNLPALVRQGFAGPILGSAMVALAVRAGGREHTLTFTGDFGRPGVPILRDPESVPPADLLISESTYGGQTHPPVAESTARLGEVLRRTTERGGK